MKLVLLVGSGAVGKMTVGQELAKITDLKLFHNHMTIDPVIEIFGKRDNNVVDKIRAIVFEEFAKSDDYGMIFTFMWAFDQQYDWDYMSGIIDIFQQYNAEIYCVELVADQKTRLERNKTENRLTHKSSKRDIESSEKRLLKEDSNHRFESNDGEIQLENYIKIDNSKLSPDTVARMIKEQFQL
jgi:hypothetical protein